MNGRLQLTRAQVVALRRHVNGLDQRLARSASSLRHAAWAGLQDSVPRAALLAIHARVSGARPDSWEDAALVQLWGPRHSAYVVPERDRAVFTLSLLPDAPRARRTADQLADRLESFLDGQRMTYAEAGRGLGVPPNLLRYAAPTGRVLLRWDGARPPSIWTVPAPDLDPGEARLELARRYLHVFGPTTPGAFAQWAGIAPRSARAAFDTLARTLTPVRTPLGDAWILAKDEAVVRSAQPPAAATVRLLPSGDTHFLLQGADRQLLVPDPLHRRQLWPPRVWPGAVLVDGEISGTWRRAAAVVTVHNWRRLSPALRGAVELEAASLPLPEAHGDVTVRWES